MVSKKVSDSVSEIIGIGKIFRFRSDFRYRHTLLKIYVDRTLGGPLALAVPKETKIGTPKCLFSLTICAKTNLSTFKNNSVEILLTSNRKSVQENGPRYTQWTMMDTMDHNG